MTFNFKSRRGVSRTAIALVVAVVAIVIALVLRWFASPALVNDPPSGTNIIAFGDSITAGSGAGQGEDYPSQLSRMAGVKIINRGVPGDTTADGLARLERDVMGSDPRIVIVCLGGNDMLRRMEAETTFANLEKIIRRIQSAGALVVLVGVDGGFLVGGGFAKRYRELAVATGVVFVPDVLAGILTSPKLKADQIHPNGKGYTVMAERIYKALKPHLTPAGGNP